MNNKTVIEVATIVVATFAFAPTFAGTWAVVSVASHHFDNGKERDYEQRNWGLGVEHETFKDFSLIAGFYRNSIRHTSTYLGAVWTPLTLARTNFGTVELGAAAMRVDGYKPKALFVAFPVLSIENEKSGIGLNIPIVPKTKRNVAAIGLQLKVLW